MRFKTIIAAALLAASSAHASLIIDDWTVAQSLSLKGPGSVGQVVGDNTTCANILGCTRDIVIENIVSPSAQTTSAITLYNDATPLVGYGYELSTSVPSSSRARFTMTWDGDSTSGNFGAFGTGVDFSSVAGVQYLVFSDGGLHNQGEVKMTFKDTAGKTSILTYTALSTDMFPNIEGYTLATFSFSDDFVTESGFLWSAIAGIQTIVNVDGSERSLDFAVRTVSTNTVPEPMSLALVGMALVGVRRWKQ